MPRGHLPAGTVTFLFSDIEGSTKLWEAHPEPMRLALARHDALMRVAIAGARGHVFKTVGDAFCAAFATAPEAVEAALNAQLALTSEPWADETPIKVRMALHTGAVENRDDDYFGAPLNRVARLLGTAHGGQSLLSQTVYELALDSLPEGAKVLNLGEHRLKDLGRPEGVFQLLHPDLPAEFPPLRSLDSPDLMHNLPLQMTSFVGREKETAEVAGLFKSARLVTLTGSGGCGKTRLALQVAADLLDGAGDGVWLVELAALSDGSLVPQAVANVLHLKEEAGKPALQTLTDHLKGKQLMLVLDNCEHLLDACAKLADAVLRGCPRVLILASSREALGISGETTYRVPSLSLPDPKQPQTPESLPHFEAVRLFIDRAVHAHSGFAVTNENAPALASVCFRLDGIPLAIELAAARVRSLSVEDIDGRLDHRFRLLTGGSRTALPRQQTLRSLIDWSYDLLGDAEKALLQRLSVFAGGWTLESAEAVCPGESVEEWEVLDLLTSLCDKSLVTADPSGSSVRYRLLETVRQYARDRLVEDGGDRWRDSHLAHFLGLAEEAEPHLLGTDQLAWLDRLEGEHDNLRAALEWGADASGGGAASLRLAGALWRYWYVRGHLTEGRERLSRALGGNPEADPAARAKALSGAGPMASNQGDYAAARALLGEALAIRRELGDRQGISSSLDGIGLVARLQGDHAAAQALHEESLAIRRELGDRRGIAGSLNNLGIVARLQGNFAAARALQEEGLAIFRELGDPWGTATLLGNLGTLLAYSQPDWAAARTHHEQSLAIRRELGDPYGIAHSLTGLGIVATLQGDHAGAEALLEEGLAIRRELGDRHGIADSLHNLGTVADERGDTAGARSVYRESLSIAREIGDRRFIANSLEGIARTSGTPGTPLTSLKIWGAAQRLREETGPHPDAGWRSKCEQAVGAARAAVGDDDAFGAAWAVGRAMPLERAIELALSESGA